MHTWNYASCCDTVRPTATQLYHRKESAMGLQKQIKKDLMAAMKAKDEKKKSALRILMGEFGRHADKEISDGDVIKIVKKLILWCGKAR